MGLLIGVGGQVELECGALARLAVRFDAPGMVVDNKVAALRLMPYSSGISVRTTKRIEHQAQGFLGQARPVIGDLHDDLGRRLAGMGTDRDAGNRGQADQFVAQQQFEEPMELLLIDGQRGQGRGDLALDGDVLFVEGGLDGGDAVARASGGAPYR